jgi:hypothetical protein
VTTPRVVPFAETDTPIIAPSPGTDEVTVPEIVFCCAFAISKNEQKTRNKNKILFIAFNLGFKKNQGIIRFLYCP